MMSLKAFAAVAAAVLGSAYLVALSMSPLLGPSKAVARQTFAVRLAKPRPTGTKTETGRAGTLPTARAGLLLRPTPFLGIVRPVTAAGSMPPRAPGEDGAARPSTAMGTGVELVTGMSPATITGTTPDPTDTWITMPVDVADAAAVDHGEASCLASDDTVSPQKTMIAALTR